MVFSSALFLTMFFPVVLGVYFLAQEKLRNCVLLAASLLFYAWGEPKAVFVMIALIAVSYFIALGMERFPKHAKSILLVGIVLNLSALLFYKYWMFLLENVNLLSGWLAFKPFNIPKIALPIGISFYVFQILSYLIDVYRGQVKAQKKFISLATYVSLFPQLVAGPIVRYETIAEDLENRATNFDNVYQGLRRFIIGLAKKVLIADQMAFIADTVFDSPVQTIPTVFAWIGACPEKVVNIAGDDVMSKYDAAIALADKYGLDKSLIKPVSVTQTTGIFKAKRAASGTLDNSKLKSLLGIKEIHLEV